MSNDFLCLGNNGDDSDDREILIYLKVRRFLESSSTAELSSLLIGSDLTARWRGSGAFRGL